MISWSDEAIEAANALLNKEWAAGIPDDLLRRALDAAVTAQEAREFPGFKEWALEGEYHRGRAEALEEAANEILVLKIAEGEAYIRAINDASDHIRALKETKGAS